MNRKGILEAASKAVHAEDMEHDYGKPENNFETIAELWATYWEAVFGERLELNARDVAAMMILLKVARVASSKKDDHWVDIAGYAACGGEIDGEPNEQVTFYADNLVINDAALKTITGLGEEGPFELRFTAKKEDK